MDDKKLVVDDLLELRRLVEEQIQLYEKLFKTQDEFYEKMFKAQDDMLTEKDEEIKELKDVSNGLRISAYREKGY